MASQALERGGGIAHAMPNLRREALRPRPASREQVRVNAGMGGTEPAPPKGPPCGVGGSCDDPSPVIGTKLWSRLQGDALHCRGEGHPENRAAQASSHEVHMCGLVTGAGEDGDWGGPVVLQSLGSLPAGWLQTPSLLRRSSPHRLKKQPTAIVRGLLLTPSGGVSNLACGRLDVAALSARLGWFSRLRTVGREHLDRPARQTSRLLRPPLSVAGQHYRG